MRRLVTAALAALLLVASALSQMGVVSAHSAPHATYPYGPPSCMATQAGHVDQPGTWVRWPVGVGSTCWTFAPARKVPPIVPSVYSGQVAYIGACTKPRDLVKRAGQVYPSQAMTCTLATTNGGTAVVLRMRTYVWGAPPTEYDTTFQNTYVVTTRDGTVCADGQVATLKRYMSQQLEMYYYRTGPRAGSLAFTRDLRWTRQDSPVKVLVSTGKTCS